MHQRQRLKSKFAPLNTFILVRRPVNQSTRRPVDPSTCQPIDLSTRQSAYIYNVTKAISKALRTSFNICAVTTLYFDSAFSKTMTTQLMCNTESNQRVIVFVAQMVSSCLPVDLSTRQPVDLSTRRPLDPSTRRPDNPSTRRPVNPSTYQI